jgi:hypothetical protein
MFLFFRLSQIHLLFVPIFHVISSNFIISFLHTLTACNLIPFRTHHFVICISGLLLFQFSVLLCKCILYEQKAIPEFQDSNNGGFNCDLIKNMIFLPLLWIRSLSAANFRSLFILQ